MKNGSAPPSDRAFGWTVTGVLMVAAAYGAWQGNPNHPWVLIAAAATALVTLTRPLWLAPLRRAWMRVGDVLHHVVSPVVLGVIFFGIFTPVGWTLRLLGRDAMARRFDLGARTYWIRRDPPGPADDSFTDPF